MLRRSSQDPRHHLSRRPRGHRPLGYDRPRLREQLHLHLRQLDLAGTPQFPSSSRPHAIRTGSDLVRTLP